MSEVRAPKFSHYDVVLVRRNTSVSAEGDDSFEDDRLVVLGISETGDGTFSYAVAKVGGGETWMVPESSLAGTGARIRKSDLYPGIAIKVKVDERTGEGSIVDPDEQ